MKSITVTKVTGNKASFFFCRDQTNFAVLKQQYIINVQNIKHFINETKIL